MKKTTTILRAMNDIRADYILESELADQISAAPVTAKHTRRRLLIAAAAALALVAAVGLWVAPMLMKEPAAPAETSRFTLQRVYKSHYAEEAWGPEGATSMYVQAVEWAEHPEGQVFTLNGVEYPLTYNRSLYYPDEDTLMHEYSLDIESWSSSNNPYVLLTDDGSLFRTGYFDMACVDMSQVGSNDDLIRLVEEAMADFADFDSYDFVKINKDDPKAYRRITWYNTLGDYQVPGPVSMGVMPDGSIMNLYKEVAHELTITEADLPTDDEIRALVAEDVKDTDMSLHGPVRLGDVCHKEIIEQNGVECIYVYVEAEYKFISDEGKEYDNLTNLWYIIPIESPDTTQEKP